MFYSFALITVAIILVDAGWTKRSPLDVIQGVHTSNVSNTSSVGSGATPKPTDGRGDVNPVPGAVGSRLDQGFDVTGRQFRAPFTGTVVYATPSDPGWAGGGYIAIKDAANPHRIIYFAEGLLPTLKTGDTVKAGDTIAMPAMNPYNGVVGNIEFGPADPASPNRPLAQATTNAVKVVNDFYAWVRSLGGPVATSTSNAGRP